MSDYGASLIARALRFVGLCLFYSLALKYSGNPNKAVETIGREYTQQ